MDALDFVEEWRRLAFQNTRRLRRAFWIPERLLDDPVVIAGKMSSSDGDRGRVILEPGVFRVRSCEWRRLPFDLLLRLFDKGRGGRFISLEKRLQICLVAAIRCFLKSS